MPDDPFVIDDDRYSRLRLIAWWEQEKLANAKVLVVGAGALGNEVLKNLALMGVGLVYVVDFDKIEESNLTRSVLFRHRDCGRSKAEAAATAVTDLNPDTKVVAMPVNIITEVGLGLFRDVEVVIGCLDNREARLWVNRCCWKVNTPWIDGGIQEVNGVAKVFRPPDGACYECAMTENDYRLINLRYSCPLLRQEDLLAGKVPTAPTISSIIAGLQTQEALKLIHGMPVKDGVAMIFNGISNQMYSTQFQRRDDCLSHETYDEPIDLAISSQNNSVLDLFNLAREHFESSEPIQLQLDRDLVVALACHTCGTERRVMKAQQAVGMRDAVCPECQAATKPVMQHVVGEDSELVNERLHDVGVPDYDIVRVVQDNLEKYFLIADDCF